MPGLPKDARGEYTEAIGLNRDPRGVFSVVEIDGGPAIRISGETFGGLITRADYENYHLRFEFRWGGKRWAPREEAVRDSGCCYHSAGPLGASYGFWMRSFEFQIQEGDCGDFYSLAGVVVDAEAVAKDAANPKSDLLFTRGAPKIVGTTRRIVKSASAESPFGQWNTLDLYCVGQTSVHVVNGRTVLILTGLRQKTETGEAPLTKGKLQFQSEGAEVFYRRIALRRFAKSGPRHCSAAPKTSPVATVDVLAHDQRPERAHVNVAKRDRAVIPLQHQRLLRRLRDGERGACRAGDIDVALDELPVQQHA